MKSRDHQTIKILRHDVEHRSVINLLKILEDSECPEYMLQSILEWTYNAKVDGFDFNPKATTRKASIVWMYQALEKSHQLLPHVVSTKLEDHDDVSHIVCFDFTVALLSLLQNEVLMSPENLVINPDNPTSMFRYTDNKVGEGTHCPTLPRPVWWADHMQRSTLGADHSLSWWHSKWQQGSHRTLSRIVHNVVVYWGSTTR